MDVLRVCPLANLSSKDVRISGTSPGVQGMTPEVTFLRSFCFLPLPMSSSPSSPSLFLLNVLPLLVPLPLLFFLQLPSPSSARHFGNFSSVFPPSFSSFSSSPSLPPPLENSVEFRRSKRQFGFGGCCPLGGVGPVNFPFCCSAPIGFAPCCGAQQLLPMLPPPMPLLPPPLPLPLIGGGCCPCCMPMCVPICIRSSCAIFGGGMFGGGGGCPFRGWKKKRTVRQKRWANDNRRKGTIIGGTPKGNDQKVIRGLMLVSRFSKPWLTR